MSSAINFADVADTFQFFRFAVQHSKFENFFSFDAFIVHSESLSVALTQQDNFNA